jgi:hypothetical protein
MNDQGPRAVAVPEVQGGAPDAAVAVGGAGPAAGSASAGGDDPPAEASEWQLLTQLTEKVVVLQEALAAHEQQTEELRTLVLQLRQALVASGGPPVPSAWQRWRESRRGLGASLTLTGVVAIVGGVLLHFALLHEFINTTLRLGYLFGLTGLVLLLLGLLIVF